MAADQHELAAAALASARIDLSGGEPASVAQLLDEFTKEEAEHG